MNMCRKYQSCEFAVFYYYAAGGLPPISLKSRGGSDLTDRFLHKLANTEQIHGFERKKIFLAYEIRSMLLTKFGTGLKTSFLGLEYINMTINLLVSCHATPGCHVAHKEIHVHILLC